jgi:hypothetical protein
MEWKYRLLLVRQPPARPACILRSTFNHSVFDMIKRIAIALFGILFCPQLDLALFGGRYSRAAMQLALDIRRGFGF